MKRYLTLIGKALQHLAVSLTVVVERWEVIVVFIFIVNALYKN
jgi:hypothetical protein